MSINFEFIYINIYTVHIYIVVVLFIFSMTDEWGGGGWMKCICPCFTPSRIAESARETLPRLGKLSTEYF